MAENISSDGNLDSFPFYKDLKAASIEVLQILPYQLDLGYEHLTVEEVLRQLLPRGIEIPSSFEQIGHIAHLNLREEVLPFKSLIGQVILDKSPSIRTVVNKIGTIENEFRTFPMEVIAGEEDSFSVTVKESGARFIFDFREVYWNSRLQMVYSFSSFNIVPLVLYGMIGARASCGRYSQQRQLHS